MMTISGLLVSLRGKNGEWKNMALQPSLQWHPQASLVTFIAIKIRFTLIYKVMKLECVRVKGHLEKDERGAGPIRQYWTWHHWLLFRAHSDRGGALTVWYSLELPGLSVTSPEVKKGRKSLLNEAESRDRSGYMKTELRFNLEKTHLITSGTQQSDEKLRH